MTEHMDSSDSNVRPLAIKHGDLVATEERLVRLLDAPIDVEGTWELVRDGVGLDRTVTRLRPARSRVRACVLGVAAALVISGAAFAAASRQGPSAAPVSPPGARPHQEQESDSSADPDRLGAGAPSATFTPSADTGANTSTTSSSDATGSSTTTRGSSEAPGPDQTGQDQQGQDQQGQDEQSSDPTTGQDQGQGRSSSTDGGASSSSAGDTSQGGDGNQNSSPPSDSQS